jgi:hypothetical protein
MHLIYDNHTSDTQIWASRKEDCWTFFVHGPNSSGDPQICQSFYEACELAGIDTKPILALAPFLADK